MSQKSYDLLISENFVSSYEEKISDHLVASSFGKKIKSERFLNHFAKKSI